MRNREKHITHALFVLPGVLLYCFQTVIPVIVGAYYSVTNWNGISKTYAFVGMANFAKALSDTRFLKSSLFSIRYTLLLILCVVSLSLIAGLLLHLRLKGRSFFRSVFFFPAVVSMITIGLIFSQFYSKGMAAIGAALEIPALSKSILSSPDTAIYGVLIANVWKSVAVPAVLILAGLQSIPEEIVESARLDGAGPLQQFKYITLPYLMPVLSVIIVLTLKEGLMVYDYIMALTGGGPAGSTESITLMIYRLGFEETKFSYSIALSILVSILIFGVSVAQLKLTSKKQAY